MKASLWPLFAWIASICLLTATVAASFAVTGPTSITVSLGIALAKAALICWFFMNLRAESGLLRLAAGAAAVWLLIFLALVAADYATRS